MIGVVDANSYRWAVDDRVDSVGIQSTLTVCAAQNLLDVCGRDVAAPSVSGVALALSEDEDTSLANWLLGDQAVTPSFMQKFYLEPGDCEEIAGVDGTIGDWYSADKGGYVLFGADDGVLNLAEVLEDSTSTTGSLHLDEVESVLEFDSLVAPTPVAVDSRTVIDWSTLEFDALGAGLDRQLIDTAQLLSLADAADFQACPMDVAGMADEAFSAEVSDSSVALDELVNGSGSTADYADMGEGQWVLTLMCSECLTSFPRAVIAIQ